MKQQKNVNGIPAETWDAFAVVALVVKVKMDRVIDIKIKSDWALFVWGDGTTSYSGEHAYELPGAYKISILTLNMTELDFIDCCCIEADLSDCKLLEEVFCSVNYLKKLKLSGCHHLIALSCGWNKLKKMNFRDIHTLKRLYCGHNQLSELDLSACINIRTLECLSNTIKKINISECKFIDYLNCRDNKLGAKELNTLLQDCPDYSPNTRAMIDFAVNPGFKKCTPEYIEKKGWKIIVS